MIHSLWNQVPKTSQIEINTEVFLNVERIVGGNCYQLLVGAVGPAYFRTIVFDILQAIAIGFGIFWVILNFYNFYPVIQAAIEASIARGRRFMPAERDRRNPGREMDELPEIDILLPAYEEALIIYQSIKSIREAEYPQDRLNLYVLLEADDRETPQALATIDLQYEFTTLTIPEEYPGDANKPRALNYGFERTDADIVGVVDAEDVIDGELFREVADFLVAREFDFALGHLDMANENDGWLNLQFRAEYGWWYHIVIPAFATAGFPVPLGGSTCFFKRTILDTISTRRTHRYGRPSRDDEQRLWLTRCGFAGALPWDPENVTEDFELGMFLWEEECRFAYLDSITREESPTTLDGWLRQRTRWNKGKLYTLVHTLRSPPPTPRKKFHLFWQSMMPHLGPINILAVGLLLLLANIVAYRPAPVVQGILSLGLAFVVVVTASVSYGYWIASDEPALRRLRRLSVVALTLPVYWVFQWAADLRAIKHVYLGRFNWAKTAHEGRHVASDRRLTPADTQRTQRWVLPDYQRWSGLVTILLIGTALRLYRLGDWSLWSDEIYSIAVRGDASILNLLVGFSDPHPPLYYLILHFWMELVGKSATSARLLSVIFSIGTIVAIFLLGAELFDDRVGLLGALFFAVSTFQIHFGRTARMYALFVLLTVGSWYWFVRLRDGTRESAFGYILTSGALLYTHVFAVFVVLAQHAHVILSETNGGIEWRHWISLQAILVILAIPVMILVGGNLLGGTLVPGITENGLGTVTWIPSPSPVAITETLLEYAGFPSHYPILAGTPLTWLIAVALLYVFSVLLVLSVVTVTAQDGYQLTSPERVGQLALLFGIPIAIPYLISYAVQPIFVPRYTVPATVGLYLLLARGILNLNSRRLQTAIVAVVVVMSAALIGGYYGGQTAEDWQGMSEQIEATATPGDGVIVQPAWIQTNFKYYYDGPAVKTVGFSQGSEFSADEAQRVRRLAARHDRIWVIRYHVEAADGLLDILRRSHPQVVADRYGVITLYRFDQQPTRESRSSRITPSGHSHDRELEIKS